MEKLMKFGRNSSSRIQSDIELVVLRYQTLQQVNMIASSMRSQTTHTYNLPDSCKASGVIDQWV